MGFWFRKNQKPTKLNKGGAAMIPYLKYGDWYIPGFSIKFPTETEAWEYIDSLTQLQQGAGKTALTSKTPL